MVIKSILRLFLSVTKANPNGDPLNGNRPRQNYDGHGEISDVAIKRKIRNRLLDMGEKVFVQSDDRKADEFKSLRERADAHPELAKMLKGKNASADEFAKLACQEWIDVRSFGQVFAFKGSELSVGVRGPVSIHTATSIDPIDIVSTQITKSVNSVTGDKRSSDTMGMKHRVDFGVYVFKGSINTQLAEKTGFTEEDAEKIKQALITLLKMTVPLPAQRAVWKSIRFTGGVILPSWDNIRRLKYIVHYKFIRHLLRRKVLMIIQLNLRNSMA